MTINNKTITTSILTISFLATIMIFAVNSIQLAEAAPYELVLEFDTVQTFSLTGIGVDNSNGNIYVSSSSNDNGIDMYDSQGIFLARYMSTGDDFGYVNNPFDIEIDSAGNVIIADAGNGRIQVLTTFGNFTISTGDELGLGSEGIDIDNSGNIYVASYFGNKIQVYNYTGSLQFEFGESGTGDGQFSNAIDVAVDSSGNIYVADNNNERIQIFNSTGGFVSKIDMGFNAELESIDVDSNGNIAVVGHGSFNPIYIYNSAGNLIDTIDAGLTESRGLQFDDDDKLYITDRDNGRVVVYQLLYCGQPESYYNIIYGTNSSDYLRGTQSPDLIFGYEGNDLIKSFGSNNCIYGGSGDDAIISFGANNTAYGGLGNDFIEMDQNSTGYGEDGNDRLFFMNPEEGHLMDGGDGTEDICVSSRITDVINTVDCEIT